MGLGGIMWMWQRQTKDFGHTRGDRYTVLVYDLRGAGQSGKPLGRYSTSDMAKDTVELLDHVGWTGERQVHVIGVSMGGMVGQELVRRLERRVFGTDDAGTVDSGAGSVAVVGIDSSSAGAQRGELTVHIDGHC